jgi:hypothetical protein
MPQIINIVELDDNTVKKISSYITSPENKDEQVQLAEAKFISLIQERESILTEADKEEYLNNGFYENRTYQIFITWSDDVFPSHN